MEDLVTRPIVLSNGELHVGLNDRGQVHDFYYPYVGLENHSAGKTMQHRIGVWVEGEISWFDNQEWQLSFRYPHSALIGHTTARNERLGILLEFDDAVDADLSAFMRNIHIVNLRSESRDIRLFLHQAFAIGDSRSNTDTAQYLPDTKAILHYRGRRAFIVSGEVDGQSFDQHTIGLFGLEGRDGTYRDADDGELNICNVEHGRVDSTIRFKLALEGHSSLRLQYWIAAGTSSREALFIHKRIREDGVQARLRKTANWWYKWLQPAIVASEKVDKEQRDSLLKSLMIIKSHIDKRGAVIASTDTTMLNYERDAYAYCWPRDGAYVLWPLIRLGFKDEPRRFFEFCRRALHPSGYLMHKFQADGALGSSWHPYVQRGGIVAPPIQEDETAIVLFVFAQYCHMHKDARFLNEYYDSFVVPMANFMAGYIDKRTGLPKPSYDLWEEVFMTTTYTTSVVYAALLSAADIAEKMNDSDNAVGWRSVADDIYRAAHKILYNEKRQAFYKGVIHDGKERVFDETIDMSSIFGAFMFGLFPIESEQLQSAFKTALATFGASDEHPGLPRYENDNYRRVDNEHLGNWWSITTLWMAQYYIEKNGIDKARRVIEWVVEHAMSSGVFSEQLDPRNGSMISVAPLIWTHAEYVGTLLDTLTEKK